MSSELPPSGEPEILESSGGARAASAKTSGSGGGRRTALIVAGVLGGAVVLGGAAWAASWYLSSGAEAAETLPASTLGYVQVNLDPSGDQKIEALRTLNKFPGFSDHLGLDATDDLRKTLFEQIQEDGGCPDVDYDDDIAPWLGDRMAVAAVDLGEDEPSPVFVVEVTSQSKAESGLDKLLSCSDSSVDSSGDSATDGSGGYVVDGDWAIVAETEALAQTVLDEAGKSSLADDADFQHWTDAAGGDGIVTMYAAPEAGELLADLFESGAGSMVATESYAQEAEPAAFTGSSTGAGSGPAEDCTGPDGAAAAELRDFKGAAAKVRFDDGSVEVEFAGDASRTSLSALSGSEGGDLVASLPEDTALAFGGSLQSGWFESLLGRTAGELCGPDVDELMDELEAQTGLELPEDAEALTGDAVAVAVSSDFDIDAIQDRSDLSGLAVGVKVKGDPAAVEEVLDKLRPQFGAEDLLASSTQGDMIAFGPDQAWADEMAEDGGLGDSDDYAQVIPESDQATSVFYLNVDAGNDWLVSLLKDADAPDEVIDNVRPFAALGISSWTEGDEVHAKLKLTTD